LQYEDVSTAVQNLQKALKLLTTGREWSLCTRNPCLFGIRTNSPLLCLQPIRSTVLRKTSFPSDVTMALCVSDSYWSIHQQPQPVFIVHLVDPLMSECIVLIIARS
jgi:hypothetical protein